MDIQVMSLPLHFLQTVPRSPVAVQMAQFLYGKYGSNRIVDKEMMTSKSSVNIKTISLSLITILIAFSNLFTYALAQDYTTWGLPDGAIARRGKGGITGNVAYSPDGNQLAVSSTIGIWIYDVRHGNNTELDLITGHTRTVRFVVYSTRLPITDIQCDSYMIGWFPTPNFYILGALF